MIELHPEIKMPLYEQLYNALAQDIRSGALQPGKALPGRRTMAAQLGISTNTVDTAYQMLAAEGLAVTRPRSGFFVQETGGMLHTRPQHSVVPAPKATPKNTVSNQDDILYDLSTGSIDTSLFPARSWGRIQKELMYQRPELLQRGDMQGDENLRAQIARLPWRIPRRGLHSGSGRGRGRGGVPAGLSGTPVCGQHRRGGKPRLQPHPRRTGKQRHPLRTGGN